MKAMVVGASGRTGRLAARLLLERGHEVVAIVRARERFLERMGSHDERRLKVVQAEILALSEDGLAGLVADCQAIVSCLGHSITLKGVFGPPRRLVTDAVSGLCQAARSRPASAPVRLVLMNTAGNVNPDQRERVSLAERCVLRLLRLLVPPHADNEQAAEFLRREIGPDDARVDWVVVRPDSLIDGEAAAEYEVHASPTRSAIFNPGKTRRADAARFMVDLLLDDALWRRWRGQMPVVYSRV